MAESARIMFWFCRQKPIDVYFYTTREDVFNHAKPSRANNFFPVWWKNLPKHLGFYNPEAFLFKAPTLKTCPGFITLYSSGIIFPMWSDLNVEIDGDNYKYQFADKTSSLEPHHKNQFGACDLIRDYTQLKIESPWVMHCKKGVNFLNIAPTWNNFGHDDIVVLPGAFTARQFVTANVNLLFKKKPEKPVYSLLFGQPILHTIPLTERPIKLHYELLSEKEMRSLRLRSPLFLMFNNRYRRSEQLCPHA